MKARANKDGSYELEMNGGTFRFRLADDGVHFVRVDEAAKRRFAHGEEGTLSYQNIVDKECHQMPLL